MTKLTDVLKRRDVQHMQLARIFLYMNASVLLQLDTTTDRTLVILFFANARKTSRFIWILKWILKHVPYLAQNANIIECLSVDTYANYCVMLCIRPGIEVVVL